MPPAHPLDVCAGETAAFVGRFLPGPGTRILDVGCGRGELAAMLLLAGHAVTAIDLDAEAVAAARARGVDAHVADFLEFSGGPFDALLFSYSLHHIHPLPSALARAPGLLVPQGRVICEEYAFENIDEITATWFFGTQELLLSAGLLLDWEPAGETAALEPLERWEAEFGDGHAYHGHTNHGHGVHANRHGHHRRHGHHEPDRPDEELHAAAEMKAQLSARFEIVHEETGPGLYGFWLENLPPDRAEVALRLLALERGLVGQGALRPLGIRWVATRA
jgi:SAM-dependent methyltransferase